MAESAALIGRSGDDSVERWELIETLHQGLALLSEQCRELLQVLYFDPRQPSYAEVSERLGVPVGSIGPTRARCLKNAGLKKVRATPSKRTRM